MLRFMLGRLGLCLMVMLCLSILTFLLTNTAIDPARAIAGDGATAADVEAARVAYGLDRPLPVRYAEWLGNVVQGDFGVSYKQRQPVLDVIVQRLPVTLTLGGLGLGFALLLSLPMGILAAMRPNSWLDRLCLGIALIGQAIPAFWLALMGVVLFAVNLKWLPVSGSGTWRHFVLPAIILGYYATPTLMRLTRAGMIEALASDYIRTARAKGLLERRVVLRHALRNALLPVVSVAAVQFGFMLGGSVVIETIFAMRGVGYLAWESISLSDIPVVQAIVLMTSVFYVVLTLAADLVNAWLDPRMRAA